MWGIFSTRSSARICRCRRIDRNDSGSLPVTASALFRRATASSRIELVDPAGLGEAQQSSGAREQANARGQCQTPMLLTSKGTFVAHLPVEDSNPCPLLPGAGEPSAFVPNRPVGNGIGFGQGSE